MESLVELVARAAEQVRAQSGIGRDLPPPTVGIVLGSGLGSVTSDLAVAEKIPTASISGFPRSTVAGHAGELVLGSLAGKSVATLSGRVHGYEGYPAPLLGLGVRLLHKLGCGTLIVTNGAGALNPAFGPGSVMLIEDHVSFPSLSGGSPLGGELIPGSPRFVDLTDAYSPELRSLALGLARRDGIPLQRGVYVMVGGPNFETPAEVRFLRQIGGDAVGMSTVPEVIVARQLGMGVLGLSAISNLAAGLPGALLAHEDVLAMMARSAPVVAQLVRGVVAELPG